EGRAGDRRSRRGTGADPPELEPHGLSLIPTRPSRSSRRVETPPFLAACRRQPARYTPVWLMRQAGRYLPEYRAIREKTGFLELCRTPDLAAEVTVGTALRLGVDAAIIFADILLVLDPMGAGLEFTRGDGPAIQHPVRSAADVDRLREVEPGALAYVAEAVKRARAALPATIPLIGFRSEEHTSELQ